MRNLTIYVIIAFLNLNNKLSNRVKFSAINSVFNNNSNIDITQGIGEGMQ
jgi:hypothetical protein